MNLFFKSYRIHLIFFLLITCEPGFNCGMAQDISFYPIPWIQEIILPDLYADIPNESFFLDQFGHLFLGKDNGVTIISGNKSVHLHMDGPVFVSGNGLDSVFFACHNDFGLITNDEYGKYRARSLNERIPVEFRQFIPSQLIHTEEGVFLNADAGIYHFSEGRMKTYPFPAEKTMLFEADHELLLMLNSRDILVWSGSGFAKMEAGTPAGNLPGLLLSLANHPEGYSFTGIINDREILVVSPYKGILIMDCQGRQVSVLGRRTGLPDHDVRQTHIFKGDELWILGPHTLHKINHPSSLHILEMDPLTVGRIYASTLTEDQLVLGTSHGIFIMGPENDLNGQWKMKNLTPDFTGSFHLLDVEVNKIFAAGTDHLISIEEGAMEIISAGNFTGLYAMTHNQLVAASEEGIIYFKKGDNSWTRNLIDPQLSYSHSLVRHKGSLFFICRNSAFRLSDDLDHVTPLPLQREDLLLNLTPLYGELYLVTNLQVYRFEESEETFMPLDEDHEAMILSHSRTGIETGPYPILQHLGDIIDLNMRDSVLYLTGKDKVAKFEPKVLNPSNHTVPIRIEAIQESSRRRPAGFHLGGLEFQSAPDPLFRHKLIPVQENWSEWSNIRDLYIDRLRPGDYILVAQAKDLYGQNSARAEFQFIVNAPFYKKWYAYTFYTLVLLIVLFLIQKMRLLSYQRAESRISQRMQTKLDDLTVEKEKSDRLVADILPEKTAAQLKSTGKSKWDKYERATVLFSDIQGFTKIAEEMNPEALIDELDKFFFHFDSVVEKYNIEKIKTIGDAYMAAGGIPEKNSTNPVEVVLAALEMQTYMQQLKTSKLISGIFGSGSIPVLLLPV